jgi:hypothetical protein
VVRVFRADTKLHDWPVLCRSDDPVLPVSQPLGQDLALAKASEALCHRDATPRASQSDLPSNHAELDFAAISIQSSQLDLTNAQTCNINHIIACMNEASFLAVSLAAERIANALFSCCLGHRSSPMFGLFIYRLPCIRRPVKTHCRAVRPGNRILVCKAIRRFITGIYYCMIVMESPARINEVFQFQAQSYLNNFLK